MPTPVSSARQCLAQDTAAALDEAVAAAARRGHAQTTSLHVFSALLSLPSPLREALSRFRSSSCSPRFHLRALDLCFTSALDRLSSPSNPRDSSSSPPPVSNSLMAAIKRSQANQRRNPDTFHLYQQSPSSPTNTTSNSFSCVKVELQQLILAMLDDPVVSRVFADAGFHGNDIKAALLRPPPSSVLTLPHATRIPPLFLCNFSTARDDLEPVPRIGSAFPSANNPLFSDGSEENCRRIGEVMVKERGRNPLLVGAGALAALRDFEGVLGVKKGGDLPKEIAGLRFFSVEEEVRGRGRDAVERKLEEVKKVMEREGELGGGALLSFGDLQGFVEKCGGGGKEEEGEEEEWLMGLVEVVTRMMRVWKGKLWLIASSANYETYMKFLARYPSVDKDWDLQRLPITSVKFASSRRHSSLMEPFAPLGGFQPIASSSSLPSSSLCQQQAPRCWQCNEKYEQEVSTLLKDSSLSFPNLHKAGMASWLHNDERMRLSPSDIKQIRGDHTDMKNTVVSLQKKWDGICQKLHNSMPTSGTVPCHTRSEAFPWFAGFPSLSNKGIHSQLSNSTNITQCQSTTKSTFSVGIENALSTQTSVGNVSTGLQIGDVNTIRSKTGGPSSCLLSQSDLDAFANHPSPSSCPSVSTDLTLGNIHASPFKEGKLVPRLNMPISDDASRWLSIRKSNVIKDNAPTVVAHSLQSHSYADPQFATASTAAQKSLISQAPGKNLLISESWSLSSSIMSNKSDSRDTKELYRSMIEKVSWQEEAIYAISETIMRCRVGSERCRGIWLSFVGPDKNGKKRVAMALSEFLFGTKGKLIHTNLDVNDSRSSNTICDEEGIGRYDNFRGKLAVDHIAGKIRSKPFSVVFLENIDKADFMVQSSLSEAVRTGRFRDSHGREVGTRNAVFIATCRDDKDGAVSPRKQHCHFSEEKILATKRWKMKILVDDGVRQNAYSPVSSSKRKLGILDEGNVSCELQETFKRPKESNQVLDLNLPLDDAATADAESSSTEHNRASSENPDDVWLEEFFGLVDGIIKFKPFDFDALAKNILREVSECLRNSIGGDTCRLEIGPKAMEEMVAAAWWLDSIDALRNWLQQVLSRSFAEANKMYNLSNKKVLRLVACEDSYVEEQAPGICLPSRVVVY